MRKSNLLAAAAIAGMLSGAGVQQARCDSTNSTSSVTNTAAGKVAPVKKEPKVQDCGGSNDCKGLGGCKSGDHGCKFKNTCKGKGGCSITKDDIKKWRAEQKQHKTAQP